MDGEGTPFVAAGFKVAARNVQIAGTDGLRAQAIEQCNGRA